MNLLTIFSIELKKIRRTHIFWILLIPLILLWVPAVLNVDSNFSNAAGLSPEMNFFFQMYLGMSWFLYPASLVVITVMLNQLERTNQGILKMLSLSVSAAGLCLGKFLILLLLSAFQMVLMAVLYYPAAAIASTAPAMILSFLCPRFCMKLWLSISVPYLWRPFTGLSPYVSGLLYFL